MKYKIYNIPYQYYSDLFYNNKETYDMMSNINYYYQPLEIEFIDGNYIIPILVLSKEMIEKGMYYCNNKEAKNFMQECINKWIENGEWKIKCDCINAKTAVILLDKAEINNVSVICNICESIHTIKRDDE
jgi:hypothetical protein